MKTANSIDRGMSMRRNSQFRTATRLTFLAFCAASLLAAGCSSSKAKSDGRAQSNKPASNKDTAPTQQTKQTTQQAKQTTQPQTKQAKMKEATFGAGCFWCVEAVFLELDGVAHVESGYTGGQIANPTYEAVCAGVTGHAEVCRVVYDPEKITFTELLEVFWKTHDPTTLNRQGNDVGTQYRSAIFYHDDEQKALAEKYKAKLDKSEVFSEPIVTEITALGPYYKAENYHQNYFKLNPGNRYCQAVIPAKLAKLRAVFGDKLKKEKK